MSSWIWPVTAYLAEGLLVTLWISLLSVILATILGLLIAAMSRATHAVVPWIARLYVEVFRGVPSLMILLFVFFALPQIGLRTGPFTASVIGLGLWGGRISAKSSAAPSIRSPTGRSRAPARSA